MNTSPNHLATCRKYNIKNREEVNRKVNERSKAYRMKIFDILGYSCCKCGFNDIKALQIDHINGGGSIERRKGHSANRHKYILDKIMNGKNEYQILCANCNWIKRYDNNENRKCLTVKSAEQIIKNTL